MTDRARLWIGTSWKMNKTLAEARRFAEALIADAPAADPRDPVEGFYRRFGWTPSQEYQRYLVAESERARRYRSGHHYDARELGLEVEPLRRTFGWVYQRFSFPLPEGESG